MVLKAVFLEFSGVVIKDADLRQRLIDDLLLSENLRPNPAEYDEVCTGCSDRICLQQLLERRGRIATPPLLDKLLAQKATAYIHALEAAPKLPLYPGLTDLLYKVKTESLLLGLVTGTARAEVDWVLAQANLADQFAVVVTAADLAIEDEKPAPKGYQIAIARLNERYPDLALSPADCVAIEAFYPGIAAAKSAQIPVVGVAHHYPYRMMQRRANWVVDYLNEIEFPWLQRWYDPSAIAPPETGED
ncbi:MAG TPA: HAD family phosphatase [Candidatus Obscuribacterales bacterium]